MTIDETLVNFQQTAEFLCISHELLSELVEKDVLRTINGIKTHVLFKLSNVQDYFNSINDPKKRSDIEILRETYLLFREGASIDDISTEYNMMGQEKSIIEGLVVYYNRRMKKMTRAYNINRKDVESYIMPVNLFDLHLLP